MIFTSFAILHTSTAYAHWNNRIPAEARTGILIAIADPPSSIRELAGSVASPLTRRSYGGIKRQRKTITDPLTLISQTSGRWEKSTYGVGNGSPDWASAAFLVFFIFSEQGGGAGGQRDALMFEQGSEGFRADILAPEQISWQLDV